MTALVVDLTDHGLVSAGIDIGRIFRSTGGGTSWSLPKQTSIFSTRGVFAQRVVVDHESRFYALYKHNPYSDLYALTGVYVSEDFSFTWRVESGGFSLPNAHSLVVSRGDRMRRLGISGTGLYRAMINAK